MTPVVPPFVYISNIGSNEIPYQVLEIDGRAVQPDTADESVGISDHALDLDDDSVTPIMLTQASSGRVEYYSPDSFDQIIHFRVSGHMVKVRVGSVLLEIDTSYIDRPASPARSTEGGAE